jgi:hypothetical protein
MTREPVRIHPRDRLISVALAVTCLLLAVALFSFIILRILGHTTTAPRLIMVLVPAVGSMGLAAWLLIGVRRGRVPRWRGRGKPAIALMLLVPVLGGMLKTVTNEVERLIVARWGVTPRFTDMVMGMMVLIGLIVFAIFWRRTSTGSSEAAARYQV